LQHVANSAGQAADVEYAIICTRQRTVLRAVGSLPVCDRRNDRPTSAPREGGRSIGQRTDNAAPRIEERDRSDERVQFRGSSCGCCVRTQGMASEGTLTRTSHSDAHSDHSCMCVWRTVHWSRQRENTLQCPSSSRDGATR
jgi:hypothetical protein